jgi:DNA-binding FadR family transcriptional regulator
MEDHDAEAAPQPGRIHNAMTLAARIESEIEAAGWPVGRFLGSEPDLLTRYGVGRGVFREAVRLLEHYSVARMRTGRNGGLVVQEPDTNPIARGAALILRRRLVTPEHLAAARRDIELSCVTLAAQAIDKEGRKRLQECLIEERSMTGSGVRSQAPEFHRLLAELTRNPVFELMADMLIQLTQRRMAIDADLDRAAAKAHRAHAAIADAICDGNVALARRRMSVHVDAMATTWKATHAFDAAPRSPFNAEHLASLTTPE